MYGRIFQGRVTLSYWQHGYIVEGGRFRTDSRSIGPGFWTVIESALDDASVEHHRASFSDGAAADRLGLIDALILHSPLVGPTTTRALASALSAHGWTTAAPDLRSSLSSPLTYIATATRAPSNVDVLVGHSGAGAMLPAIAQHVGATLTVFVDAIVPDATTTYTAPRQVTALLDQLPTVDGRLPPWHEWWPTEVLTRLVPDRRLRDALTADNPRVSRAFYDEPILLPELWWQRPGCFVQLSSAYDDDRARAERWGWPTSVTDGQHLDLLTRPGNVADVIVELAATALQPDR